MAEEENTPQETGNTLEGGTYEIIRNRLENHGQELRNRLDILNNKRKEIFGSVETSLISSERVSTDNNCIAQDIFVIGEKFLFGYNVVLGLKSSLNIEDVFAVYRFHDNTFAREDVSLLKDNSFNTHFHDLFKYYKDARFVKFTSKGPYLYMVFRITEKENDLKVFKWQIEGNELHYIDDRSVHEYSYPPQHEFEWKKTTRDMHRAGEHGHVSIEDKVFVECIGGDLTIKVEDNTADGNGIYEEDVDEKDQTLDDADIMYSIIGSLILMKIRPYQEKQDRFIVFNQKMETATRIDDIESCCILLPDDHGIIFSKGYYLQTGEYKRFDTGLDNMIFERRITSPNGEDFMYIFYNKADGLYVMLSYNLITQTVETPTICHGFSLFHNGNMVYFKNDGEPQKHHAIQLWKTPYCHADYVSAENEHKDHFLYKLGNKDIVRCMAECHEVLTLLNKDDTYAGLYIDIGKKANDVIDTYFWLNKEEVGDLTEPLSQIKQTSNSAIDEFEKVRTLKKTAADKTAEIQKKSTAALKEVEFAKFDDINGFVKNLADMRTLRGEIISLKEVRYIDVEMLDGLEEEIKEKSDYLSEKCVEFLLLEEALDPYKKLVEDQAARIEALTKATEGKEAEEEINETSHQLEMLIEIVSNLKISDATQTTRIIDSISGIFSKLNQVKATLKNKIKELMSVEGVAEFNAQIKLLNQSIINYLDVCETPQNCEEYLTKIMIQLEELEGRFSEFDEFIVQIADKRDEAYSAFESRKVALQEALNKRTTSLMSAAERILKGVKNRVSNFKEVNEINSYFAGDLMIDKVRDIVSKLKELGDTVKADDIEGRLKTIREDTVRQLKDKKELFDGDNIIKMGQHKFSVNTQHLDLTVIEKDGKQFFHLTGTKFFQEIEDPEFMATRNVWTMDTISENENVYRGEFLAYNLYKDIQNGTASVDRNTLESCEEEEDFLKHVQTYMGPRYNESYTKGVHDYDAAAILKQILAISGQIGLLSYNSRARALAVLFWNCFDDEDARKKLTVKISSFGELRQLFPSQKKQESFITDLQNYICAFLKECLVFEEAITRDAAEYLFEELAKGGEFTISDEASTVCHGFEDYIKQKVFSEKFKHAIKDLEGDITGRYELIRNWVNAYIEEHCGPESIPYADEATALLYTDSLRERKVNHVSIMADIPKMAGDHRLIEKGIYKFNFNEFMDRLSKFEAETVPAFEKYLEMKKTMTEDFRRDLLLDEFKPRILTSFVRNKLINDVYLPLVGDNLAKQVGVAGENKRTDLMGMLLLISPPGYGKTTLMEYIANRLGLIFMKINAPAIGHHVTSLDPSEAPNAAAREEMKKLNLAFEMGDNVMIYLDDIQHTNPELLQKFISLCDGQRKIEGVYRGQPKTYDLRGRKVVVCMAGNPYTESGEKFQIPDMLANRADTYNLGDIIGDTANVFNMSYVENSLTSNPVLGKLSSRSQKDLYSLMQIAETDSREGVELEGNYSIEEMNELVNVLKKMFVVRNIISKVNAEYIRSAAMQDEYRTEPPFKMQGSYRNMNKIAEKILPIMNDEELRTLILSHYENESQTLTSGAEFNMLKFRELFEVIDEEEIARLASIRKTFSKNQQFRGMDEQDPMAQIIVQMGQFTEGLEQIRDSISGGMSALPEMAAAIKPAASPVTGVGFNEEALESLKQVISAMGDKDVKVVNTVPDFFSTILRDQLELMRTWMESLFNASAHNKDLLGSVEAMVKDIEKKFATLLEEAKPMDQAAKKPASRKAAARKPAQKKPAK